MPAAKFKHKGKTLTRVKSSVFLHPTLHKLVTKIASESEISLSDLLAQLAAKRAGWKPTAQ